MKKVMSLVLAIGSFSAFAETALITKSSGGGFRAPDSARNESCQIFADKVVITTTFGSGDRGMMQQEVRSVKLSGNIENVLTLAAAEQVEKKDNFLCDGPSTSIRADLNGQDMLLFATGGCGSPRQERIGNMTKLLVDMVNKYCPNTYDFGAARR